jgi:chemotaxis protein CheX
VPLLLVAAQEVFELMVGCPLQIPVEPPAEQSLDITAMVGLAGQLCGLMTLRCSAKSAFRMASEMLGIEADQAEPEMWDAVGEVCNMTAGNFKNKITALGDGCMLSVPTVITGGDYRLHSLTDTGALRTVLLFEGEPVVISLEIHS